MSGGN